MTNRKKQLTDLAQRVMDGDWYQVQFMMDSDTYFNPWPTISQGMRYTKPVDNLLSAVKSLEQELLPDYQDTWFTTVNIGDQYDGEPFKVSVGLFEVRKPYKYGGISVFSEAPTEEAARLAALLLALAEMEEE